MSTEGFRNQREEASNALNVFLMRANYLYSQRSLASYALRITRPLAFAFLSGSWQVVLQYFAQMPPPALDVLAIYL